MGIAEAPVCEPGPQDGVHLRHVGTPEHEGICVFEVIVATHGLIAAKGADKSRNGRGHAVTGIGLEIIGAEAGFKQLGGRIAFPDRPLAGTEHANCIREGAIENFRVQTQRDDAQRELVQWLRISNQDAERYRDGLTVEGMEIRGFKGWFVRNFVQPEDFMKSSFREQGVDQTAALARQGGGWFVITSQGRTVADLIETGRKFERMALLARERNIAIHPMTQIMEEETGVNQLAANHQASMIPQFVLRVGYLKSYPEPVSLRRPVNWFVQ